MVIIMSKPVGILRGQSQAKDPLTAVTEFHAEVNQPDMALVIFFCSSQYDLNGIAKAMNRLFPNVTVIGCTTAGEIGPDGYQEFSMTGASFPAKHFTAISSHFASIDQINEENGLAFTETVLRQLEERTPKATADNTFAFLLIDGLSLQEDKATRILQGTLGNIGMFGGSAGDDLCLKKTQVFINGAFHQNSAILTLVTTNCPFKIFKEQHFVSTETTLVVTQADPKRRIVNEFNGYPAAIEYARCVGANINELNPMQFSASPIVVRINGVDYVRAIQSVNPDKSLTFYCAIDNGLILKAAYGVDMLKSLEKTFAQISTEIGLPELILGCDCILRKIEIQRTGIKKQMDALLQHYHVVGFSTYGEQYMGMHISQTLTGIAIGPSRVKHHE